jgi:subtilisin family serine protease
MQGGTAAALDVGSLGDAVAVDFVDLPTPADAAWALEALSSHPDAHFAELDGVVRAFATPNDPRIGDQPHLATGALYTDSRQIDPLTNKPFPGAWNRTAGLPSVVVCVMDSGVDFAHPDLAPAAWRNAGEIPGNGLDDDGNGYVDDVHGISTYGGGGSDVGDDFFHGTHLAGLVAAACNNGVGGCGVAPGVKIMGCKFLDAAGNGYTSDAVRCLNYAVKNGADVTLNSYGGLAADSAALKAAIVAAQDAGQLFVAAAGNDYGVDIDATPTFPAAYDMPAVVSVIASDGDGNVAPFSNIGATAAAVAAPGVAILSTVPGGGYAAHDGTSQAAAQVAGAAALLLSAKRGAGFKGAKAISVREDLLAAARRAPALARACASGGELDVGAAMARMPVTGPRDPKASAWLLQVASAGGGAAAAASGGGERPTPAPALAPAAGRSGAREPPAPAPAPARSPPPPPAPVVSAFPRADPGAGRAAPAAAGAAPLLPPPFLGG